jgi:hypothetical protein
VSHRASMRMCHCTAQVFSVCPSGRRCQIVHS